MTMRLLNYRPSGNSGTTWPKLYVNPDYVVSVKQNSELSPIIVTMINGEKIEVSSVEGQPGGLHVFINDLLTKRVD